MKKFKYIATLTLAVAGLATQADAIPVTYSYDGMNFTFGTGPAGFTTSDNIVARFTVNDFLAPNTTFDLASIGASMSLISNGVYKLPLLGGTVTTNAFGNIVGWDLNAQETLPDLSIVRLHSSWDGVGWDSAQQFLLNGMENQAGNALSPGIWGIGIPSVPEEGATLSLICLALITLLGFKHADRKSAPAR